jgi:phage terminase large subunit-like protein
VRSMKFRVKEDVKFQTNTPMFGAVRVSFAKGTHTPKNEQEELALKALVKKGLATVTEESDDDKAEKTRRGRRSPSGS